MVNSRLVPLTSLRLILFAKVHQCVECPPKDLLREDDRPLASVQPHHPFCGGGYLYFSKSNSTSLTKVLLQTYIEYLRGLVEDSKTINHHGREREIDLDLINGKPTQVKPAATQAFDLE